MIRFTIGKKSKKSRARLGLLRTPHGNIETPSLVAVATQATVKTLSAEDAVAAGSQVLIANTFHLHLKPGEDIVRHHGGLHSFMNWPRPLMTDSAGYQVFSLGFGLEHGVGKIGKTKEKVRRGAKPKDITITDRGVWFRSPVDGRKLFIGPRESIKIQESLGADIIFAFDECSPPNADHAYTVSSLEKTHAWAKICLETHQKLKSGNLKLKSSLFGIIQGGKFKDLRQESAKFISSLPFAGFGIGGEFGDNKKTMTDMLRVVIKELPEEKPRHLLGIGHPEDIIPIIKEGVDTFDCTVPTHYARHGVAFTSAGRLDLQKRKFLTDKKPIDPKCNCRVCKNYSRGYITHLLKAREVTPLSLLTFHNIHFFNSYVAKIRAQIRAGKI